MHIAFLVQLIISPKLLMAHAFITASHCWYFSTWRHAGNPKASCWAASGPVFQTGWNRLVELGRFSKGAPPVQEFGRHALAFSNPWSPWWSPRLEIFYYYFIIFFLVSNKLSVSLIGLIIREGGVINSRSPCSIGSGFDALASLEAAIPWPRLASNSICTSCVCSFSI